MPQREAADIYGNLGSVPTAAPEGGGGQSLRTEANPNDFGAQVQGQANETANKFIDLYNDTTARDAATQASKKLADLEFQYNQNKGTNAVTALAGFQKGAGGLIETSASNLSPAAGQIFRDRFSNEVNSAVFRSGAHAAEQLDQAQSASLEASMTNHVNNMAANITDSNSRQQNITNIRDTALEYAHVKGVAPDVADGMVSKFVGDAYAGGIKAVAGNDPDKANVLFNEALNGKFTVNRNGQDVTVPYLDAGHRAQISSEMNAEFKQQEQQQIFTARSYAAMGINFDQTALVKSMKNAGRGQDYITAEVDRLNQVKSNFGAADNQYKVSKSLQDNEAKAMNGLPIQPIDESAVRAAYPREPDKAQDIINHQNDLQHVAGFVGSFPTKTVNQIYTDLESFKPQDALQPKLGKSFKAMDAGTDNFTNALPFVQGKEGGFVSNDSGKGPTNFGINQEANPDIDVSKLTKESAAQVMKDRYWKPLNLDNASPAFAKVALDGAVNQGVPTMQKLITEANGDPEKLIELRQQRYNEIAVANPAKAADLPGWTKRLNDLKSDISAPAPSASGYAEQSNTYKMMSNAADAYTKQLYNDPSGTLVSKDPILTGLLNDGLKDPTKLGSFIDASIARQDAVQVPKAYQAALPQNVAVSMANSITTDPASAPDTFNKLQQQSGAHWPAVYQSLVTQGKLPAYYQAVGQLGADPETANDAKLLARWAGEDTKGKTDKDLMGDKVANDMKTNVAADPGVQSLMTSLYRSGASRIQVDDTLHSIQSLAFAKQYYNKDPAAAQNAIQAFTSKYEFMPNGGARVPANVFDAVTKNAETAVATLENKAVAPAQYTTGFHGQPKPDEYFNWVKNSPTWVTSPHEDALILKDPQDRIVRDKDGKPITVPFSLAAPIAPSAPSQPAPPPG